MGHRLRSQPKGFSYVEVLIAASISAAGLLAVASLFPVAATTIDYTGGLARATARGQQRLEQLKNLPFATVAALETASSPPALPAGSEEAIAEGSTTLTRRTWVRVTGAAPRREATVTVLLEWPESTGLKSFRLDTVIAE